MSAQAGIWNSNGRPIDKTLTERMHHLLKPLGPDEAFEHIRDATALFYRPFHTTPESRLEKQPYVSSKGFVLTWDGRLDNRDELRTVLGNNAEGSETDVAIVAAAFDRWGTECFRRIVGDWAVAIWDPRKRDLVLAVDFLAIRHIFYRVTFQQTSWATDLTPLVLLSEDYLHVDDHYIAGYFANDADAERTPYREIREVPPGKYVHIKNGAISVHRYWFPNTDSNLARESDPAVEERFRHFFRQSVKRRLRSDSPILAELSGGLDSSSIVCMADDILASETWWAPRVDTLSYFNKTETHGDDWIYFQKVEQYRGKTGFHVDSSILGTSPGPLTYQGFEPLPGRLGIGSPLEMKRAEIMREGGYRVVLSGIGGDEFMGGIPDPRSQLADLIMQCKLITLGRQLMAWSLVKRRPWIQLLGQALIELLPAPLLQHLSTSCKPERWIDKAFAKRTKIARQMLGPAERFGYRVPTRRAVVGGIILLGNKVSKWTSPRHPLEEARYPYLDQNLIEFMLSIPASQVLRPGERRSLMRRALTGLVPDEILKRRTKQFGARTPVVALEKHLDTLVSMFQSAQCSRLGYVHPHCLMDAFYSARAGRQVHLVRFMRAIALEVWLRDLTSRGIIDNLSPESHTSPEPIEA
jgi:asparagine synthase (glutamine-hydrolysing)